MEPISEVIREPLWAARVRPWQLWRLYRLAGLGIYDDDLLLEVGWGLYARCRDVLLVARAVAGELPCPACGAPVRRPAKQDAPRPHPGGTARCGGCGGGFTWWTVKESLRGQPRCLDCLARLDMDFARNVLRCTPCAREWTWKRYRALVSGRTRLPCPRCGTELRRPPRETRPAPDPIPGTDCPRCGGPAEHPPGRLHCPRCGHDEPWANHRRRLKQRAEALACGACGHAFTWRAWRERYRGRNLLTGKPRPVEVYLDAWLRAATPAEQLHAIDTLVNAIHGRGGMGPLFIEGSEASVLAMLDRLAGG